MRYGHTNDSHWLMLGAWPHDDILIWTHLIQRGKTADGIVRTNYYWDNGYANVLHRLIIINADGIVWVASFLTVGLQMALVRSVTLAI